MIMPVKRTQNKPSVHMLRPGPIRTKARDLAKEHYFMDMIDKGFDPYLIKSSQMESAITVLLWNTGDHFFELAKEKLQLGQRVRALI